MKAELVDGSIVELEKECDCLTHDEPHWVHMDRLDKKANDAINKDSKPGLYAYITAELRRLKEKERHMGRLNINRLIPTKGD